MKVTTVAFIVVIVIQSIHSALTSQELNRWKRHCYHYGYASADTDHTGNVIDYKLIPGPGRFRSQTASLSRLTHFIEIVPDDPDYGDEIPDYVP
ncbi:hypothetical protein [Gimesia maris]|jgi:hypothetical protein|uniref:Uncharacterized protein n=1 Tax=Gimesia maris TaxID=122 RepID=A0A3D3R2C0_9PLAN|nr:hypothetical protein [Gimesia maris]QDT79365.1 hypothetical protein Mal35_28230 [Gimesia maris]HCO22991.1 hypothetical protein [Gimesia maris]|tara:strand:+ start:104836 stop:105117 length:282 start_codon:yes stop_codon:yes gene_type:complete